MGGKHTHTHRLAHGISPGYHIFCVVSQPRPVKEMSGMTCRFCQHVPMGAQSQFLLSYQKSPCTVRCLLKQLPCGDFFGTFLIYFTAKFYGNLLAAKLQKALQQFLPGSACSCSSPVVAGVHDVKIFFKPFQMMVEMEVILSTLSYGNRVAVFHFLHLFNFVHLS